MKSSDSNTPKKDLRSVMAQAATALTIIPDQYFIQESDPAPDSPKNRVIDPHDDQDSGQQDNPSERKRNMVTYNKRTDTYEVKDLENLSGEELAEIWDLSGGGSGYFVPKDIVPDLEQYLAEGNPYCWFEGLVSEDRFKELEAGKRPKRAEIRAYQKAWIEKALRGNKDADLAPAYQAVEIKGLKGRKKVAIIMCSGYSFSGVSFWIEGFFSSYERADNYLTRKGYVD